jgi:GNAT superfamily N-acetyltransferase
MHVRAAFPNEAQDLTALALRSKAHWPFDPERLKRYRPQLEVHADDIRAGGVFVAVDEDRVIGFYALSPNSERLYFLFVEPAFIGRGIGKLLWRHALATARGRGWTSITLYADRFAAAAFYRHQQGRVVGTMDSELGPLDELRFEL